MPSLRELQLGVMHALLHGESSHAATFDAALFDAARFITAQGISPALRMGVYANTARTNFIESLVSSFPAIRRLVGEDYFRHCARDFHKRHPSLSGDLQPAGAGFPQYLLELHGNDQYRYLGEVAWLEWLIQETLLAADHGPLDLTQLSAVAPADYDNLRFHLHPSMRLFASQYPCLAIWEANVGSEVEPEPIDLASASDRLLMVRDQGQLKFHRLSRGEQSFVQSVQAGECFSAAVESGTGRSERDTSHAERDLGHRELDDAHGEFFAAAALRRFVLAGVIVDFQ
jgi:hypothetical protein